ncbi:MAG TPA: TIGR02206 family membrane protein [Gemmatimonadota bacterium]|nr:TIGR02206 family membrane protein [Gemmatimonadota bacterium]
MDPGHLVVVAGTAVAAIATPLLVRRRPAGSSGREVRWSLAALLVASVTAYLALAASSGEIGALDFLPLHLCDLAIFIAVFALLTRSPLACEMLYYWALAGTTLAILTPDVSGSFPDWRWVAYFTTHGLVVVSATTLVFGMERNPRRGSAWRVFLITLGYAAVVGAVDAATGANFLYLARKPAGPTLLDWFGPWPVYIGVAAGVALALFTLLEFPFRRAELTH